jgi:anti-sigma regulatory factor (Ser/Thr protein kinase)
MPGSVSFRFVSVFGPDEVSRLRDKVGSSLELLGVERYQIHRLVSIADELVCNILEHSSAAWVELGIEPGETSVKMHLRDDGAAFDSAEAIRTSSLEDSSDEGRHLGHYMVRQMATYYGYLREEPGVNRLDLEINYK